MNKVCLTENDSAYQKLCDVAEYLEMSKEHVLNMAVTIAFRDPKHPLFQSSASTPKSEEN